MGKSCKDKSAMTRLKIQPYHQQRAANAKCLLKERCVKPRGVVAESITYLGLLRTAGLMLYLSPSWGTVGTFFGGASVGVSTSKPVQIKGHKFSNASKYIQSN